MKQQTFKRRLMLALFALYIGWFFWYLRTNVFSAQGATIYVGGALLVGAALGFVVSCFRLKSAFVRAFSSGSLREGTPDEFPLLDKTQLERLTLAWESLGFERRDFAGNMDNPRGAPTFSRTFAHPTQNAVADISQSFSPAKVLPFTASVTSFWGERAAVIEAATRLQPVAGAPPLAAPVGETKAELPPELASEMQLWMLVTHNRLPNKFWSLMRQRRLISRRLERGATPETLWQAHLQGRAEVEARLNQPHLSGDLEPLLAAYSAVLSAQIHARLRRTPAWKFGVARFSLAKSPARYDGELPPLAR